MRAVTSDRARPSLHEQARVVRNEVFGRRVFVRAFNAGANLATINLTPRAVRADYPIYKRDRIITDEKRVLSAITEAGCELSRVGIAEHLRKRSDLANGRGSHSSEATPRAFGAARSDARL